MREDKFAVSSSGETNWKKRNIGHHKYDDNHLITDIETYHDAAEDDPGVVLRRHNRKYLHSVSTVSNDALSSDDDNETLDILFPLPHVNTHERSLVDETKRNDKNGMIINYAIHKFLFLLLSFSSLIRTFLPFIINATTIR
jgi:hypothetical protein